MKDKLQIEIDKALVACDNVDWSNKLISVVAKMKPWVHLNSLLMLKIQNQLK